MPKDGVDLVALWYLRAAREWYQETPHLYEVEVSEIRALEEEVTNYYVDRSVEMSRAFFCVHWMCTELHAALSSKLSTQMVTDLTSSFVDEPRRTWEELTERIRILDDVKRKIHVLDTELKMQGATRGPTVRGILGLVSERVPNMLSAIEQVHGSIYDLRRALGNSQHTLRGIGPALVKTYRMCGVSEAYLLITANNLMSIRS